MKLLLLLPLLALLTLGCTKGKNEIYGNISAAGTLIDDGTGAPLSGIPVTIVATTQKTGSFGPLNSEDVVARDTTDASGAYSMSFKARGEVEFVFRYDAPDARYVRQAEADRQDYTFNGIGDHKRNFQCYRSAWVEIVLRKKSAGPVSVNFTGPIDAFQTEQLNRDTTLRLTLIGNKSLANSFLFKSGDAAFKRNEIRAAAGETLRWDYEF
jgi:hypothetical protein